jgi:hypothetical protein
VESSRRDVRTRTLSEAGRKRLAVTQMPHNTQMQRTCQECHAFCFRKSRATLATPLI